MTKSSAQRWATLLPQWGIPEPILAAAPESPWTFPVEMFRHSAEAARTRDAPSVRLALEALDPPGAVLDVGCGAGAASVPLVARGVATSVVGVDTSADMLAAFAEGMSALTASHAIVEGAWPAAADAVEPADVVVCAHVVYNVADLVPFVRALGERARRRVVIELTETHPRSWLNPLWLSLHGLSRPDGPTAADALAVVAEAGIPARLERWDELWEFGSSHPDEMFALVRRMLCLSPDRDDELRAALARTPRPATRGIAAIWWDVP